MKLVGGTFLARLLVGGLFVYAAWSKLLDPQAFADSIAAYQILPYQAINLLSLGLPLFELVCGLLVITGVLLRVSVLGILVLLGIFILALISTLVRGLSIDCGCFGGHSWIDASPWVALLRDGILLMLGVWIYRNDLKPAFKTGAQDPSHSRPA